jgi:hypothetical protein
VAKHNAMIRLATLRFGMLEPLRKAPAFFERAVAAHFYHKREELLKQAAQWVAEAKAMAVYEGVLRANHDATKAAYTTRLAEEVKAYKAAHPELEKEEEERKKKAATAAGGSSSGSYSSAYYGAAYGAYYGGGGYPYYGYPSSAALAGGSWDSVSSTVLPKGFKQSAALSAASAAHQTARTAYTTWATQTAVMSHQVFARGIATLPRAPFTTYIPELAASTAAASAASSSSSSSSSGSSSSAAAAGASSSSSYYGAGPAPAPAPGTGAMQPSYGVDMVSIAAATESAAQDLADALAKLSPPEALDEDLGGL